VIVPASTKPKSYSAYTNTVGTLPANLFVRLLLD